MWLGSELFYGPFVVHGDYFGGDTGQTKSFQRVLGVTHFDTINQTFISQEYARLNGGLPPEQHWLFMGESGQDGIGGHYCGLGTYDHLRTLSYAAQHTLLLLPEGERLTFLRNLLARTRQPDHSSAVDSYITQCCETGHA